MNINIKEKLKAHDTKFIKRCIQLSQLSVDSGDAPFGSLITIDDKLIVEALNNCRNKISDHTEIVAMHKAHMKLCTSDLSDCTLYTSCEPCPMCSFMIREYKIKRVVFAIKSPKVGGYSKWPILQDKGLTQLKPIFGNPPQVVSGYLEHEALPVMSELGLLMLDNENKA